MEEEPVVPSRAVHLMMDQKRFGREFPEVHDYMDRGWETMGIFHRRIGHDKATVDEIERRWGPEAAEAARWHIRDDYTPAMMLMSLPSYIPEITARRLRR